MWNWKEDNARRTIYLYIAQNLLLSHICPLSIIVIVELYFATMCASSVIFNRQWPTVLITIILPEGLKVWKNIFNPTLYSSQLEIFSNPLLNGNHKIKMCITLWKQLSIMNFFITTSKKRKFKKRKIDLSYLNDWHSRNGQKNAILVEKHDIVTARFFVTDSKVKELLRMGMGMLGWTAGQKLIKIAWFSYFEFEF